MSSSLTALHDAVLFQAAGVHTELHVQHEHDQKVTFPRVLFHVQVKQHLIRRLNERQSWEPVVQVPINKTDSSGKSAAITPTSPALCRCTVISPSAHNSLTITGVSPFVIREICFVDSFGRKPI